MSNYVSAVETASDILEKRKTIKLIPTTAQNNPQSQSAGNNCFDIDQFHLGKMFAIVAPVSIVKLFLIFV